MIIHLKPGDNITSVRLITNESIRNWKYGSECENMGGSFASGTTFKVVEVHSLMGDMWVRVEIPGSDPTRHLKIWGDNLAHNFKS